MEIICVITEWAAAFTENIIALSAVALAAGKKKDIISTFCTSLRFLLPLRLLSG